MLCTPLVARDANGAFTRRTLISQGTAHRVPFHPLPFQHNTPERSHLMRPLLYHPRGKSCTLALSTSVSIPADSPKAARRRVRRSNIIGWVARALEVPMYRLWLGHFARATYWNKRVARYSPNVTRECQVPPRSLAGYFDSGGKSCSDRESF